MNFIIFPPFNRAKKINRNNFRRSAWCFFHFDKTDIKKSDWFGLNWIDSKRSIWQDVIMGNLTLAQTLVGFPTANSLPANTNWLRVRLKFAAREYPPRTSRYVDR
jgi:hypothetical protein